MAPTAKSKSNSRVGQLSTNIWTITLTTTIKNLQLAVVSTVPKSTSLTTIIPWPLNPREIVKSNKDRIAT